MVIWINQLLTFHGRRLICIPIPQRYSVAGAIIPQWHRPLHFTPLTPRSKNCPVPGLNRGPHPFKCRGCFQLRYWASVGMSIQFPIVMIQQATGYVIVMSDFVLHDCLDWFIYTASTGFILGQGLIFASVQPYSHSG